MSGHYTNKIAIEYNQDFVRWYGLKPCWMDGMWTGKTVFSLYSCPTTNHVLIIGVLPGLIICS
jgi:hypothetical protein